MAEYALLGKRIPKPDAVNRVTGRMVYADNNPEAARLRDLMYNGCNRFIPKSHVA